MINGLLHSALWYGLVQFQHPILVISKKRARGEFWPYAVSLHALFWNNMMKKSHQQKIAHCVWKSSSKIGWLMFLKTSFGVVSYAFSNYLCTWKSFRRSCMEWQRLPDDWLRCDLLCEEAVPPFHTLCTHKQIDLCYHDFGFSPSWLSPFHQARQDPQKSSLG